MYGTQVDVARDLWLALIRVAGAAPFLLRGEGVEEEPRHEKGVQSKQRHQ